MSLRPVLPTSLLLLLSASIAGCSTERALEKQKLDRLQEETAQILEIERYLQGGPAFGGSGAVNLFVSVEAINTLLAGLDGCTIPIPNVPHATLHVKQVRAEFTYGYPLLSVDATAVKEDIGLELQAIVVAELDAKIDPFSPDQLKLKVRLYSLVPKARWGVFDFKIRGFVRDLAAVKIENEFDSIGVISFPISKELQLDFPAKPSSVSFPGFNGELVTPDLSLGAKISIGKVIILPDGLHIYGKVAI